MSGGSRSAHASNLVADIRHAVVNRDAWPAATDSRSPTDCILVV